MHRVGGCTSPHEAPMEFRRVRGRRYNVDVLSLRTPPPLHAPVAWVFVGLRAQALHASWRGSSGPSPSSIPSMDSHEVPDTSLYQKALEAIPGLRLRRGEDPDRCSQGRLRGDGGQTTRKSHTRLRMRPCRQSKQPLPLPGRGDFAAYCRMRARFRSTWTLA